MALLPSDIHGQIVDSLTSAPAPPDKVPSEQAPSGLLTPPREQSGSPRKSASSIGKERLELLSIRHKRCVTKIAELERYMSSQRAEAIRWLNRFQEERKHSLDDLKLLRMGNSQEDWRMYDEICHYIDHGSNHERIMMFMGNFCENIEAKLCDLVEEMKHKYPAYQIRSTKRFAEAVDTLVGAVEVCAEDADLVMATISATQARSAELRRENRELAARIHLLERFNTSSSYTPMGDFFNTESFERWPQPHESRACFEESSGGVVARSTIEEGQTQHGASSGASKNLLGLSLPSVKSRKPVSQL